MAESSIAKKIIFYGGTSLRLAYASPRFSEDLDFLMIKNVSIKELEELLNKLASDYSGISIREVIMKRKTLFALLNLTHPVLKHPLNIKIEIFRQKNNVRAKYIPLSSPASNLTPIVLTADITSLKELKIKTIISRKDPKDWFDLWYISKYLKEPFSPSIEFPFELKEFKRELKRFLPKNRWVLIDQIYD